MIWSHYKFENMGDHCPRQCSKNQTFGEPECSTDGGDYHPRREQFHKDRNASSQRSLRPDSNTLHSVLFLYSVTLQNHLICNTGVAPRVATNIKKIKHLK